MKRTAKAELRAKSSEDLTKLATELRNTMFKSRMTAAADGKGVGGKYRELRRQVARLETLLGEQGRAAPAKPVAAAAVKADVKKAAKKDKVKA